MSRIEVLTAAMLRLGSLLVELSEKDVVDVSKSIEDSLKEAMLVKESLPIDKGLLVREALFTGPFGAVELFIVSDGEISIEELDDVAAPLLVCSISMLLSISVFESLEAESIELSVAALLAALLVVFVLFRGGGVVTRLKLKQLAGISPIVAT